ncbi:MAG: hypothetical protein U0521_18340 [Anaerolineae bacterium]
MKVKMILPALTEARSPFFRPIKYSLFRRSAGDLAAYLRDDDQVVIQMTSVERLDLDDEPDLVVIQGLHHRRAAPTRSPIITGQRARTRAGRLHVTSSSGGSRRHADTIFLGPGEDTWHVFLDDFARGVPARSTARPCGRSSARHPSAAI